MAVKRGKLSQAEVFYIENNPNDMSLEDMAKSLNRTEKQITKHFGKAESKIEPKQESGVQKHEDGTPVFKVKDVMGRKKRNGKHVAAIMTPNASELADATRKSRVGQGNKNPAIFRPMGDNE